MKDTSLCSLDYVPSEYSLEQPAGIAHHEAAHIVAAWAQNAASIRSVDILPNGRFSGAAVFSIGLGGQATIADVVAILAGPFAVRRLYPRADDLGLQDRLDVDRAMRAMCCSTEAAVIVMDHCRARAKKIVDDNWDAIEVVAEALARCGRLTGDDLNQILDSVLIDRANAAKGTRAAAWARAQDNAATFTALAMEKHDDNDRL